MTEQEKFFRDARFLMWLIFGGFGLGFATGAIMHFVGT